MPDYQFPPYEIPSVPSAPSSVPPPEMEDYEEYEVKKGIRILAAILVLIFILGGWGLWYYLGSRGKDTEKIVKTEPLSVTTVPKVKGNTNLISAETGGKVIYTDPAGRKVEVDIPPNALQEDTKIEIVRVAKGAVTDRYQLKPEGLQFSKPITVAIPYYESSVEYMDTSDVELKYWWKGDTEKQMLSFSVDRDAKLLKTEVMEF